MYVTVNANCSSCFKLKLFLPFSILTPLITNRECVLNKEDDYICLSNYVAYLSCINLKFPSFMANQYPYIDLEFSSFRIAFNIE